MATTLRQKVVNIALTGAVALGCAGAATTTALVSESTNATVAHAAGANGSGGESSNFIGWDQPTLDGKTWYYFDGYDYIRNQWFKQGNTWYYFNLDGAMQTGWQKIGGKWYYLENSGAMAANKWVGNYYLTSSGAMAVNTWIGNHWVGSDGAWVPGKSKGTWKKSSGKWWYAKSGSSYAVGWEKIDGTWYHFDSAGWMQTGWQSIGGKWYYFYGSGAMAAGTWVGNYYLKNDGAMATNQWIDNYHVNANGVWDQTKSSESNNNSSNNNSNDGYYNKVIDDKYYGPDGQIIIFSGKHNGSYLSTTSDDLYCLGSKKYPLILDFQNRYSSATDTYLIDLTCLLHFHPSNSSNLQDATQGDELVTIPNIEASSSQLLSLEGAALWTGRVYSKNQSAFRYIYVYSASFNPDEGIIRISVIEDGFFSSSNGTIVNEYSVKLI